MPLLHHPLRCFRALLAAFCLTVLLTAFTFSSELGTSPSGGVSQPAPTNSITQVAVQRGVFGCAGRINQMTNYLGFDAKSGAMLMLPPNGLDQRVIPLVMEVPTASGNAYVSASFAPNQINGCGATYDAVVYWPQKCSTVATAQFSTLKNAGQLKNAIVILEAGLSAKVFLMPAGAGCVSIKKEVVL